MSTHGGLLTVGEIEAARNVLWYYGDRLVGWEPGGFTGKLIHAMANADTINSYKLMQVYPELMSTVKIAQDVPGGLDDMREAVRVYVEGSSN